MNVIRVEATIQTDGELHLTQLPCRRGDKVEAVVSILDAANEGAVDREKAREEALQRFLELARTSKFRSTGPYPTRDELHERH